MIKYFVCEPLEETGLVKTAYTESANGLRWVVYSNDKEHKCIPMYEEFANAFGIKKENMVRVYQMHTTNVKIVRKEDSGSGIVRREDETHYDGMITNEKNVMLCTVEADCSPIYILDKKNKAIGMIHSGWKGTKGQIVINALNLMNKEYHTEKEDLLIYFGPSICQDCYEVGIDVYDEYKKVYNDNEMKIIFKKKYDTEGKYLLGVTNAIKISLVNYGIKEEQIFQSKYCTYHDTKYFDSYRRNGKISGQTFTCIMLK